MVRTTWVQSLVGELRSHMPCDVAKKKKEQIQLVNIIIKSK